MEVLYSHSLQKLDRTVPYAIAIGNFDGCHLGHQILINRAKQLAKAINGKSLILTFEPNPKEFFRPESIPGKLFCSRQKIRALEELNVDVLFIQEFNLEFSRQHPQDFFELFLKETLNAGAVVVGEDFQFGNERSGNARLMSELGRQNGIIVEVLEQQALDSSKIASSSIRNLILSGKIENANKLLGRPYLIEGEVVHGLKLGRSLGFPTANMNVQAQLIPAFGVYAGLFTISDSPSILKLPDMVMPAVINIGIKPTISGSSKSVSVEVHVIETGTDSFDCYEKNVGVYLKHFLRSEIKFENLDSLRSQIAFDKKHAIKILTLDSTEKK